MKITCLISFLLVMFFCSCQKEIDSENNVDVPASTDSTTLLKFIDLDTTQIAGLDTLVISNYNYDNAKRLIRQDDTEYGSAGTPSTLFRTDLFYNGADTLPFKLVSSESNLMNGSIISADTLYCNYSADKLIKDSMNSTDFFGSTPSSRSYFYEDDKITETKATYYTSVPTILVHRIYFTRSNGNTIAQSDTSLNDINNFSFSYDNNHNPFYGIINSSSDRFGPYYSMETVSEEMIYEKNNPVDIDEYQNANHYHYKYSYEYKPNGYPAICRFYDADFPAEVTKRIFIYTRL